MIDENNPSTIRSCLPAATSGRHSDGQFHRSKHSLFASLGMNLKSPYWNSSRCGTPSLTP